MISPGLIIRSFATATHREQLQLSLNHARYARMGRAWYSSLLTTHYSLVSYTCAEPRRVCATNNFIQLVRDNCRARCCAV